MLHTYDNLHSFNLSFKPLIIFARLAFSTIFPIVQFITVLSSWTALHSSGLQSSINARVKNTLFNFLFYSMNGGGGNGCGGPPLCGGPPSSPFPGGGGIVRPPSSIDSAPGGGGGPSLSSPFPGGGGGGGGGPLGWWGLLSGPKKFRPSNTSSKPSKGFLVWVLKHFVASFNASFLSELSAALSSALFWHSFLLLKHFKLKRASYFAVN